MISSKCISMLVTVMFDLLRPITIYLQLKDSECQISEVLYLRADRKSTAMRYTLLTYFRYIQPIHNFRIHCAKTYIEVVSDSNIVCFLWKTSYIQCIGRYFLRLFVAMFLSGLIDIQLFLVHCNYWTVYENEEPVFFLHIYTGRFTVE